MKAVFDLLLIGLMVYIVIPLGVLALLIFGVSFLQGGFGLIIGGLLGLLFLGGVIEWLGKTIFGDE